MNFDYKYTIVSVDEVARCMEVVYESEGQQTMHIGVRLPFEGESLENVIKDFAPVSLWLEVSKPIISPTIGHSGSISVNLSVEQVAPSLTVEEIEEQRAAVMWAQVAFEKQLASALIKFGILSEDPTNVPVVEL